MLFRSHNAILKLSPITTRSPLNCLLYSFNTATELAFFTAYSLGFALALARNSLDLRTAIIHTGFTVFFGAGMGFSLVVYSWRYPFADFVNKLLQTNAVLLHEFRHESRPGAKLQELLLIFCVGAGVTLPLALFLFLVRPGSTENMYLLFLYDGSEFAAVGKLICGATTALVCASVIGKVGVLTLAGMSSDMLLRAWIQVLKQRLMADATSLAHDHLAIARNFRAFVMIFERSICPTLLPALNLAALVAAIFVNSTLVLFYRQLDSIFMAALAELAMITAAIFMLELSDLQLITEGYEQVLRLLRKRIVPSNSGRAVSLELLRSMKPIRLRVGWFHLHPLSALLVLDTIVDKVILIVEIGRAHV